MIPLPQILTSQSDADVVWSLFTTRLEKVLCLAKQHALRLHPASKVGAKDWPDAEVRIKDQIKFFTSQTPQGTLHRPTSGFRDRKLQRQIYRLAEMLALGKRGLQASDKFRALHRKVRHVLQPSKTIAANLAQLNTELADLRRHENASRLQKWRQRLQGSDRECWKWLSKVHSTPNINVEQAQNAQESLLLLRNHWRQLWDREVDWQGALAACQPFLPDPTALPDEAVDLDVLTSMIRKQTGRAAAMDGWGGTEIAALPPSVIQHVQQCFALFQKSGFVPTSWTWIKQVHVPKSTNSTQARDWRPIAVMSIWYRLWSGSQFKSVNCQQWFHRWLPPQAIGGRQGGEVYDALCQLDFDQYAVSLDFSLAFDHVHPRLVLSLFEALGMNRGLLQILEQVWCNQQRFLTLDDQILPRPDHVETSIPQGDSFSLMAMLAVLVGPTRDLVTRHPSVTLRTFVDDRTFTGPAAAVLAMKDEWRLWSQALGLVENQAKTIHFHRTTTGRAVFRAFGVPADAIQTHPKILGCELRPAQGRKSTQREQTRLQDSIHYIRKAKFLPLSWQRRRVFVIGQGLSRAAWGWFWRMPPKADMTKVQTAVKVALGESPVASTHLQQIVRGHSANLEFRIVADLLRMAWRQASRRHSTPGPWTSMWAKNLTKALAAWGWKASHPWHFAHEQEGDFALTGAHMRRLDSIQHSLRESWRRWHYNKWSFGTRRDASGASFHSDRFQWIRNKAAESMDNFQVLTGAFVSPACFQRMQREDVKQCPFCNNPDAVPDQDHIVWFCPGDVLYEPRLRLLGPSPYPAQELNFEQRRLAWPVSPFVALSNDTILAWFVAARRIVLADRWQ